MSYRHALWTVLLPILCCADKASEAAKPPAPPQCDCTKVLIVVACKPGVPDGVRSDLLAALKPRCGDGVGGFPAEMTEDESGARALAEQKGICNAMYITVTDRPGSPTSSTMAVTSQIFFRKTKSGWKTGPSAQLKEFGFLGTDSEYIANKALGGLRRWLFTKYLSCRMTKAIGSKSAPIVSVSITNRTNTPISKVGLVYRAPLNSFSISYWADERIVPKQRKTLRLRAKHFGEHVTDAHIEVRFE